MPKRPRSNSRSPRRRSSDWIRFVTAGCVSDSASAAPCMLPASKAATNAASSEPASGSAGRAGIGCTIPEITIPIWNQSMSDPTCLPAAWHRRSLGMEQRTGVPVPASARAAATHDQRSGTAAPRWSLAHIGPNWFASVMGTGILANAAELLPVHSIVLHDLALAAWLLAAAMLIALVLATAAHWMLHPVHARNHHLDPAMAPFYGAPPMAMLTVGAGTLLLGKQLIGLPTAIHIDEALWTIGTLTGVACAVTIPYLMFTRHDLRLQDTLGSWLMPVVPPMVSAATGAAIIAHLSSHNDRLTMLLACYAMFGVSLFMSMIVTTLLWARLAYNGLPAPARSRRYGSSSGRSDSRSPPRDCSARSPVT